MQILPVVEVDVFVSTTESLRFLLVPLEAKGKGTVGTTTEFTVLLSFAPNPVVSVLTCTVPVPDELTVGFAPSSALPIQNPAVPDLSPVFSVFTCTESVPDDPNREEAEPNPVFKAEVIPLEAEAGGGTGGCIDELPGVLLLVVKLPAVAEFDGKVECMKINTSHLSNKKLEYLKLLQRGFEHSQLHSEVNLLLLCNHFPQQS